MFLSLNVQDPNVQAWREQNKDSCNLSTSSHNRKSHASLFSQLDIWHAANWRQPTSEKADTSEKDKQALTLDFAV